MSRLGKHPIEVPEKVSVKQDGKTLTVEGPNATLEREFTDSVKIEIGDGEISVEPTSDSKHDKAMWGTVASHITNMLSGATENFEKKLTFSGVGYRANASGNTLTLEMGYSHDIDLDIPETIEVSSENDEITVAGPDKEVVGQFAATIRDVRPPEPYKGSGIQYKDETIQRKEGKTAV